jgi:uncharacterized protein DUF3738
MTMAQFADQLQTLAGNYVHYPVTDSTGLEGAWDFSFTYSPINPIQLAGLRGAPPPGVTDPGASDPCRRNLADGCSRETAWPETGNAETLASRTRHRSHGTEADGQLSKHDQAFVSAGGRNEILDVPLGILLCAVPRIWMVRK